jgi:hypothetical protein
MDNPGPFTLGDFTIGAAGTQIGVDVNNLAGLEAANLQMRFAYGSGGTKTNVYVQTSLDQGATWFDIANIAFTTSSGVDVVNLSALVAVTTPVAPVNLALADNTTLNGVIGDRLRAVVVSTGTYSGQTLVSVRGTAR